jgi:hypothetical protein
MLRQELQEMLDHGIIVPTTHGPSADGAAIDEWAIPVLYVKRNMEQGDFVYNFKT